MSTHPSQPDTDVEKNELRGFIFLTARRKLLMLPGTAGTHFGPQDS